MLIQCHVQRINICIIFLGQFQKLISAAYNAIDCFHRTNGIYAPHHITVRLTSETMKTLIDFYTRIMVVMKGTYTHSVSSDTDTVFFVSFRRCYIVFFVSNISVDFISQMY